MAAAAHLSTDNLHIDAAEHLGGWSGSAGPDVLLLIIAGLIICASLTAVDGDTVKCDGQNMRLLGD
nr:hypothetical protein [Rhizobium bangladeshense]